MEDRLGQALEKLDAIDARCKRIEQLVGTDDPPGGLRGDVRALKARERRRSKVVWGAAALAGTALFSTCWEGLKKKLGLG